MKIFLLGLPGSGKTTLGKELSVLLGLRFVDLDLEIEQDTGKKIREIFEERGEIYFRELESQALGAWCVSPSGFVMATGGGTPCFLNNMETINRSGKSIFLDVPPEVIAERIRHDGHQERPLLASLQPDELNDKIKILRLNRINHYHQALFTLSGGVISTKDVMSILNQG